MRAQDCVGGQIYSQEAYLYGRFEVAMRSAGVSGVISSFFLYNLDLGCNWPAENNEIDIEMTGNSEDVLFTTHYPGPWYITDTYSPPFNPHDSLHHYAIEWEPGIVRWFVDGALVNTQDHSTIDELIYPMRIMMNLWAVDNEAWAGPWDTASMPLTSLYDYVKCYTYAPGTGDYGTNDNFKLDWEESFDALNEQRWTVEQFGGFGGNFCSFESTSVVIDSGMMTLRIEAPQAHAQVQTSFSVDTRAESLGASDVIFLNGSFNDWCGSCQPMQEQDGIWTTSVDLDPGKYEYLFTKNIWEENGSAPYQSECDYNPCDEWLNYGVLVPVGAAPIDLETVCWRECFACAPLSTRFLPIQNKKEILAIYDLMGRSVGPTSSGMLIYRYDDGSFEKKLAIPID
ncbi:MAG: family 16 glycosylhydrolase [Flavobacteriales bacterium]|nr:family 16 glycosylhydrolase [Flavobacteriales bacterium]